MQNIFDQLRQPSTWRGLFSILAAFGIVVSGDAQTAVIAAVPAAIGLYDVLRKGRPFGNPGA